MSHTGRIVRQALGLVLAIATSFALAAEPVSSESALSRLRAGNQRFVSGKSTHPNAGNERRQSLGAGKQHPFATILSCSDSRVPVELLFDQGLGDIFGVRVAGNVAGTDEIGSIEYGTEHLGTQLLVVLGHSHCGAVTAVVEKAEVGGSIPNLVDNIGPAAERASQKHPGAAGKDLVAYAAEENVWQSIEDIVSHSEIVRRLVSEGKLKIVGAIYDVESGKTAWMGEHPAMASLLTATTESHTAAESTSGAAGVQKSDSGVVAESEKASEHPAQESSFRMANFTSVGFFIVAGLFVGLILKRGRTSDADGAKKFRATLGVKIMSGFAAIIMLLYINAAFGIGKISKLGEELSNLVEVDLRSVEYVAEIEESFLESEVALERAMRYSLSQGGESKAKLGEAIGEYQSLSKKIDDMDAEAAMFLNSYAYANQSDAIQGRKIAKKFESLKEHTQKLEESGNGLLNLLKAGNAGQAFALEPQVEEASKRVANEIHEFAAFMKKEAEESGHMAERDERTAEATMGAILLTALGLGIYCATFLVNIITRPVQALASRMNNLNEKCLTELNAGLQAMERCDLTVTCEPTTLPIDHKSADEIGQMCTVFNAMLEKAKGSLGAYEATRVSLNNVVRETAQSADQVSKASRELDESARQVEQATNDIAVTIQGVATASGESARGAMEIASGSEHLAITATHAAEAVLDLENAIQQVREVSTKQKEASEQAGEVAEEGKDAVERTVVSMERIRGQMDASSEAVRQLGDKGQKIGDIVSTIEEISQKTNLLALNAAIEAARAGEQGKGFAVVADEVRKLAERSTAATKEIGGLIEDVQNDVNRVVATMEASATEVEEGVQNSTQAGESLAHILGAIGTVTDLSVRNEASIAAMSNSALKVNDSISSAASISEQAASSAEELSASAEEVAAAVQNVSAGVEEQAAQMEEITNSSKGLNMLSIRLNEQASLFTLDKRLAVSGEEISKLRRKVA